MSAKSAIAFFNVREPAKPTAKAKAREAKARALTKTEEASVRFYIHADPVRRKQMLRDQANAEAKDKLAAKRKWRRDYQCRYRDMKRLETVIL